MTNIRRDFREQQRANTWRLRLALAAYFVLAILAGRAAGTAFLHILDPEAYYTERLGSDGQVYVGGPHALFGYVNQVSLAVLLLAWVEYRRMRRHGDELLLSLVDARPLKEMQLENTGEEIAIAANITAPRMWVVERADLNAFACERPGERPSVALTRGLLDELSREEIQAVVAHEIAHIRNGDTRLITLLLGLGRGFHVISALALGPLRALYDIARHAETERPDSNAATVDATPTALPAAAAWDLNWTTGQTLLAILATPLAAVLLLGVSITLSLLLFFLFASLLLLFPWLVCGYALWQLNRQRLRAVEAWVADRMGGFHWAGLLLFLPGGLMVGPAILVLGVLVPITLVLLRLGVSRNREFQADATAVEFTRNPGALRSALEKIRDRTPASHVPPLPHALNALTVSPARSRRTAMTPLQCVAQLLDTHPPLDARIARLAQMASSLPDEHRQLLPDS